MEIIDELDPCRGPWGARYIIGGKRMDCDHDQNVRQADGTASVSGRGIVADRWEGDKAQALL
jgi:hypothetical protein